MIRLRRLLLDQIGDQAARFPHVVVDCTDPTSLEPLDTIIWLKNGGGKTSLLALLFSLLNPHARDFLGFTLDERTLGDYIRTGDTSHVAAEWQTPTGIVVTGAVYEWPERRRPVDAQRHLSELHKRWYVFAPRDGVLTFDDLPLRGASGTGRLSFEAIGAELRSLARQHRRLELTVANSGIDWKHALEAHNIDPTPFRYQKMMNHTEGSIDERFRFSTAADFVNFLLELAADEEASSAISQNARSVADKLARRPVLEAEQRFCRGVADLLEPLDGAWRDRNTARETLESATRTAQATRASFKSAAAAAEREHTRLQARHADAHAAYLEARRHRNAADDLVAEYRRFAAELHVTEAEATVDALTDSHRTAKRDVDAWAGLGPVLRAEVLDVAIADIDAQLTAKHRDADGVRRQRNAAAAQLRDRLDRQAQAAFDAANAAKTAADAAATTSDRKRDEAEAARTSARDSEVVRGRAIEDIAALDAKIAALRADGLAQPDETVTDALARCWEDDERASSEHERIGHDRATVTTALGALRAELPGVVSAALKAEGTAEALGEQFIALTTKLETLEQQPRLRELAQSDTVSVYSAHTTLERLLAGAIEQADADIVDANVGAYEDRRNAKALQDQELLASPRDVEAVLAELERGGVRAVSGFAYVAASVPRADWEKLIAASPAMVAGVIVEDDAVETAQASLEASGIKAASLISVTSKSALHHAAGSPPAGWIVPAEAALYDTDAATDAAAVIGERLEGLDARLGALADSRDADRNLLGALRDFLERCPEGTLQQLGAGRDEAAGIAATRRARENEIATQTVTFEERLEALAAREGELAVERLKLAATKATLEPVANLEGERPAWEATRRERDAEAADRHTEANAASEAARAAHEDALRERGRYQEQREIAGTLALEAGKITVIGGVDEDAAGADPAALRELDALDTDALRDRFALLDDQYHQRVSDPVLADRRATHVNERSGVVADIDQLSPEARERIDEIRALPEALEAGTRHSAARRARERLDDILGDLAVATKDRDGAREVLSTVPRGPGVALMAEETPTSRADAEARCLKVERDRGALSATETKYESERSAAKNAAAAATQRAISLQTQAEAIDAALPDSEDDGEDDPGAVPYDGTDDGARDLRATVVDQVKGAAATATSADRAVGKAGDQVKTFAMAREFAELERSREAVVSGDTEALAPDAARLAGEYRERAAVLEADLGSIAKDREIIVEHLGGEVRRALDLLNRATRVSRLPEGLGQWTDQPFLKIDFDDPRQDDVELKRLVGTELDEFVQRGNVPEGPRLLQRAVHAAVPKGFRIKILKPNAELFVNRVPITEMGKWSGGEKLTAAVLLYCTLARLRTSNRANRDVAAGALVLDNPLGKSSYVKFLALQRHMAQALGVQLLYTTAVKDLGAVGTFPNVVRCRNVLPRNRSDRAVVVDDRVGEAHDRDLDDGRVVPGEVSAARVARQFDHPDRIESQRVEPEEMIGEP